MMNTCRTCAYGFHHEETELGVTSYRCHRYKALGNSMAVPVIRWILKRVKAVAHGE